MINKKSFILFLYFLGISVISLLGYCRLVSLAHNEGEIIKAKLDQSIKQIETFYQDKMRPNLSEANCNKILSDSYHFLYDTPYVRSITVFDGNVTTCSTISGKQHIVVSGLEFEPQSERLFYTAINPFLYIEGPNPTGALVFEKTDTTNKRVSFAIYPELYLSELRENQYFDISIHFESYSFTGTGIIQQALLRKQPGQLFTLQYNFSFIYTLMFLLYNYGLVFLLWIIIATLSATPIYNSVNNFNVTYWRVKKGLKKKQFYPYIQPIFNPDGSLSGGEVLVRWIHPKEGIISPADFIDEVESNGQIKQITSQLIDKCIESLKNASFPQGPAFILGINACPIQFEDSLLINDFDNLQKSLRHCNIKYVVEITERQEFTSNELYRQSMAALKKRNIRIALDDFGTGHCSLKYLVQSDIDILKIDKGYVSTIDHGPNTNVLDNIIDLARRINVPLLAEGVETPEQLKYLQQFSIEKYQGYYYARPMPMEVFVDQYFK
ncbi:cyclic diguanylate phosphodiesterase [Vibrio sp.]|nr:cyclic diguanylate phosphodiesterase [Vibrio sp.]